MDKFCKIEKDKLIKAEITKLNKLFKNIEENKLKIVKGLIQNAAFMLVTLQELQELINKNGSVEIFKNGAQTMNREYPALKSYNTTIKNYSSTIKQLVDLLPEKTEEDDELIKFLKK